MGLTAKGSVDAFIADLPDWKAYRALIELEEHTVRLLPMITATSKFAKSGLPVGNKGLDAWRTVDVCVELCELIPNFITVPKRINNSGPFYRFLADVFDALEHPEDPVSAFRGWRRHMVSTAKEIS